jgi:hypothetical protein
MQIHDRNTRHSCWYIGLSTRWHVCGHQRMETRAMARHSHHAARKTGFGSLTHYMMALYTPCGVTNDASPQACGEVMKPSQFDHFHSFRTNFQRSTTAATVPQHGIPVLVGNVRDLIDTIKPCAPHYNAINDRNTRHHCEHIDLNIE